MRAECITRNHPLSPPTATTRAVVRHRRRIRALAPRGTEPVVAILNGKPILRAGWDRRLRHRDTLVWVRLPRGGGGKNPLAFVASLAAIVFAPQLGWAFTHAIMAQGASQLAIGAVYAASTAVFAAGANAIISALLPPPQMPSTGRALTATPSPTYSLQAQGNSARLEQPIPVQYGRMQLYPDYAAQPYVEYGSKNKQFLYQLFCLGAGEYDIEEIRIEDTAITSFDEVSYEIVGPSGTVTLFPANVTTSVEVSGQELENGSTVGPFTANASGTDANYLAFDLVFPQGVYKLTDGRFDREEIKVRFEAREIDDGGTPVGSWTTLATVTVARTTTTPVRISYKYPVTAGRYECQATRTTAPSGDSGSMATWAGLRAYLASTLDYGAVTLLAVRMQATDSLSAQASRKINLIATRKVYTWTPATQWSPTTVSSRSIAWAIADALTDGEYGAWLDDDRIDLQALYDLDAVWTARGDTFDGRFDASTTVWDALASIARAGRARLYRQAGIVRIARDGLETTPVMMFTPRTMVAGSLLIEYLMPTEETADAIDVGYWDEDYWQPRRVLSVLDGDTSATPVKVELFGVVDRDQAHREGLYLAAVNRYRRRLITFEAEMDAFVPSPGDLVVIAHDMPAWGQSGEITAWSAGTSTVTCSEPLTWTAGTHYLALRNRDGSVDGPIVATAGATAYEAVLASAPAETPYTGQAAERTIYTFGPGETWRQPARVISITPTDWHRARVECINEDNSVHTADTGVTAPAIVTSQLPTRWTVPAVTGLIAMQAPDDATIIVISWQPAVGAEHYLVEASEDADEGWTRVGETRTATASVTALHGTRTYIRVAGVGLTRGPWAQVSYGGGTIDTGLMWDVDDTIDMWDADDTVLMWA